jgi:small-conductance mechanosensitive channel
MFDSVWDFLQQPIFSVSGEGISIMSFVYLIVVVLFTIIFSRLVIRFLKRNVYSKMEIDQGARYTLSRLVKYVFIAVGILIGLQMVGFDLSILAFLGGLLGIGIGFGLQNIFLNFASGLILLFERPIKVGDVVEIDGLMGTMKDIGFRVSIVNTFDNESIIVPNSDLVTDRVKNLSFGGDTNLRVHAPIGVAYGTSIDKVREVLLDIAKSEEKILEDPPPKVVFKEHGDSSLNFDLLGWVETPKDRASALDSMREKIDDRFNEEGIEMPYPTRDVYLFSGQGQEEVSVEQLA